MWMHDSGNKRADTILGLSVGMMIAAPAFCAVVLAIIKSFGGFDD